MSAHGGRSLGGSVEGAQGSGASNLTPLQLVKQIFAAPNIDMLKLSPEDSTRNCNCKSL